MPAAALLPLVLLLVSQAGVGCALTLGADGPVSRLEILEGGQAELMCDSSLPASTTGHDTLMLLVWYKNNSPVYSYDARVPSEWANESFNSSGRMHATAPGRSAKLLLSRVTADDEGVYHCRVDFQLSPTRNSAINLTVIVLPSQPFFMDETPLKVEGKVRPYHEGENLVLSCFVIGGRPPPQVRWYSGDTLLDTTDEPSEVPLVRENKLYLPLTRQHACAPLECRASNTDLAPPLISRLQLELYVTAESIELTWVSGKNSDGSLIAGKKAVVHCRAIGAYPQPSLSWWLDHSELTTMFNQSWNGTSRIADTYAEITPTASMNGAALSCVATNVLLAPNKATTTTTEQLTVSYSPTAKVVKLGPGRVNVTAEGALMQLRCEVKANPPATTIRWYFNDTEINSSQLLPLFKSANVTASELTVLPAQRIHSGRYMCRAANIRGDARSDELQIDVTYAPECGPFGVHLKEEVVHCQVESIPPPDTFLWRVRGAGELQLITTATPSLRLSLLQGSLDAPLQTWCEASNWVGSQRVPCESTLSLKHLRPAPPKQCDMTFELDAFHIHCQPGGNATYHVLSVWRMSITNSSLALAWRSRSPYDGSRDAVGGAVGKLAGGDEAGVAACNNYGCSADTMLRPSAELLQAAAPPWWRGMFEKDFGVSIGIIVIIVVFIVSSLLITKVIGRFSRAKPPVIQVLQLDEFTARDYIDTLERKARSHKSCSSVYSAGSLDSCPPLVDRSRKPMVWACEANSRECLPDITSQLTRESAV